MTVAQSIGCILVDKLGLEAERLPFKADKQYADFFCKRFLKVETSA